MLSEPERTLFNRLSVFAGDFTLDAAEAVCGNDRMKDVLALLVQLVEKSLVVAEGGTGGAERYRLLETLRQYGRERLAAIGEAEAIHQQHAAYYFRLVKESEPDLIEFVPTRLKVELDNLRAALRWSLDAGDAQVGLRLAAAFGWFWVWNGDLAEGEGWLASLLAQSRGEPEIRARALLALATLIRDQGDLGRAQPLFEESLSLCRQIGDIWGVGRSLIQLAHQADDVGDERRATALAEESLAICRQLRDGGSIEWALNFLGGLHEQRGDLDQARAHFEEALQISRERGGPGNASAFLSLGSIAQRVGDDGRAEALFQEALASAERAGRTTLVSYALRCQGELAQRRGDHVRAERQLEESLTIARKVGSDLYIYQVLFDLATLARANRDPLRARSRLAEGLTLATRVGKRTDIALGIVLGGVLAAEAGASARAVRLFGAAEVADPRIRTSLDSSVHEDYERILSAARTALSPEAFAAAWAEGQAMTLEQAVAYALEEAVAADERPRDAGDPSAN